MAGQEAAIGALGILIFAGLIGKFFLRKTGFSDVFLLLIAGVFAGALLPSGALQGMQELMLPLGAIALLMIMLEEGFSLTLSDLFSHAHKALFFGVISFLLSAGASFLLCYLLLGLGVAPSLVVAVIFSSVAPELVSGFLQSTGASKELVRIGKTEAVFTEALSVILAVLLLSGAALFQPSGMGQLAISISFIVLFSVALGGLFALLWKAGFAKLEPEYEHLAIIGLAAALYALCGSAGGNGVISVFAFAFLIGNSPGSNLGEVKRFQSEISFFLRTFFFVFLGALLFHSPKPLEIALAALALSLLLAAARVLAGKALALLEKSAREQRLLEWASGRGLTVAVLSIIAYEELAAAGTPIAIDLPLLALFVIFFTNLFSALFVLFRGKKRRLEE